MLRLLEHDTYIYIHYIYRETHQKYIYIYYSIALNMDITYGHSNELDVEKHVTYTYI